MLRDIHRYSSVINPNLSDLGAAFELRELQLWIVKNNRKIIEEYQDSKGHTSASNKVHAKESRIKRIFIATIILGLIEKTNKTSPISNLYPKPMYIDAKVQYVYTGFGILLNLLIRNMNLESEISREKDPRKKETKKSDLALVNDAIYKLVDSGGRKCI